MDDQLARTIGERVRAARVTNNQTQVVVAGLCGVTADYLYQIERGRKIPAVTVLMQLATVLRIPVAQLLDGPGDAQPRNHPAVDLGAMLQQALVSPFAGSEPPSLEDLHDRVRAAWQIWQESPRRYTELGVQLPGLIADTTLAQTHFRGGDMLSERRAAHLCATDLYALLRSFAKRVGRLDLALLVADRAVHAADAADDPRRLGVAQWNMAHVLLAQKEIDGAEDVAMRAADVLAVGPNDEDLAITALRGELILLGGVAAARRGDVWLARARLEEAAPLADRVGEQNVFWTAFGPTNVAMHAVSIEVEAGDAAEALRLAEHIDHARSPSIERRVAFLLEQARGYVQRKDFGGALALLRTAGREAPEDLAHRPLARELLAEVVRRGRRGVAADASDLVEQVGLSIG